MCCSSGSVTDSGLGRKRTDCRDARELTDFSLRTSHDGSKILVMRMQLEFNTKKHNSSAKELSRPWYICHKPETSSRVLLDRSIDQPKLHPVQTIFSVTSNCAPLGVVEQYTLYKYAYLFRATVARKSSSPCRPGSSHRVYSTCSIRVISSSSFPIFRIHHGLRFFECKSDALM